MLVVTGSVRNYGLDWITLSQVVKEGKAGREDAWLWKTVSEKVMVQYHHQQVREVRFGGYSGVSFDNGRQRIGTRSRNGNIDFLYLCSGGRSEDIANLMHTSGILEREEVRVTRLDEQATIDVDFIDENVAVDAYELIQQSAREGHPLSGRRKAVLYRSAKGDTLYIGSRESKGNMYRLYDKSKDYGQPRGSVWRFEVERGRNTAKWGYEQFYKPEPARVKVARLYEEFLANCGVSFRPFSVLGDLDIGEREYSDIVDYDRDRKTLEWLRQCVAKPVRRLSHSVGLHDVLKALDIQDRVNVVPDTFR